MDKPLQGEHPRQTLLKGAFWSLAEGWTNQALQLVIFVLLAHYLAPDAFGLAATAILLCQLMQNVLLGGIHAPLVRERIDDPVRDSTGFWLGAGMGVAIFLVLLLAGPWIEALYGMPGLASLLGLLGLGALCAGFAVVYQARLMRRLEFRLLALRTLIGTTIAGGLGLALAAGGAGELSLAVQFVAGAAIGLVVLVIGSGWTPGWLWSAAEAGQLVRYGGHVSATSLVNFFNENADVLIVGHALGAGPAGVYLVGKRVIVSANTLLAGALAKVALPAFAEHMDDPVQGARRFLKAAGVTSLVTTPAFIGLAMVAPEFVALAFGPQWGGAVPVLRWLCLFGVLQSLGVYNHAVLLACGKPHWQTALTATYAVVNLVVLWLAVPYGVVVVAATYVARAYVLYPLSIGLVMRLLPVTAGQYARAIAPALLASAAMAAVLGAMRPMLDDQAPWVRLALLIACGALSYGVMLVALAGRDVLRAALPRPLLRPGAIS